MRAHTLPSMPEGPDKNCPRLELTLILSRILSHASSR